MFLFWVHKEAVAILSSSRITWDISGQSLAGTKLVFKSYRINISQSDCSKSITVWSKVLLRTGFRNCLGSRCLCRKWKRSHLILIVPDKKHIGGILNTITSALNVGFVRNNWFLVRNFTFSHKTIFQILSFLQWMQGWETISADGTFYEKITLGIYLLHYY